MRTKKVPMRMCVGCGEMKPKAELIRIVKGENGEITVNAGKMNGRGAYVCHSGECLLKAQKNKRLERAFATKIPPEVYERLQEEMAKGE